MKFLALLILIPSLSWSVELSTAPRAQSMDDDPPRAQEEAPAAAVKPVAEKKVKPEPVLLDFEWKKSEALENVLADRLKRVVVGAGYTEEKFKSSVVVLFQKGDPFSDPPIVEDPNKKEADAKPTPPPEEAGLTFPELKANPLDVDQLLAKFQADETADRKIASSLRPKNDDLNLVNGKLPEVEDRYDVALVSMNVTLDPASIEPKVAAERAKALEDYVRAAFTPAFGKRFIVQVKPQPIIEPFWTQLLEWLLRFGSFLMAIIVASAILLLAYIWRKLPSQVAKQFKFDYNKKQDGLTEAQKNALKKEEADKAAADAAGGKGKGGSEQGGGASEVSITKTNRDEKAATDDHLLQEIIRLETQIVEIVKMNPLLSKLMIQDFLRTDYHTQTNDEAMVRVALLLEILSKNKIKADKLNVKPEILKEFHNIRGKLAQVSIQDKIKIYEEVYWALVAFSFLSEGEQAFPPFHFLEMLEPTKIASILASEPIEQRANVLLGMSEKKSAQVLEKFSSQERQQVFEIMCQSHAPDIVELKALSERIKVKAEALFAVQSIPASAQEGIAAIGMLLGQLDFKSQYESIKALGQDLKNQIKRQQFFSAMLNEAKTEFLGVLFTDRATEMSKALMAAFGEEFKAKVLEVLPSMQRRMLESARLNEVSPAAILKALEDVQAEVRAKIEAKKLSLEEIYDLTAAPAATAPVEATVPGLEAA